MAMNYFLYILKSEVKETYYIENLDDPEKRLTYRNIKNKGDTQYRTSEIAYTHPTSTNEDALITKKG